MKVTISDALRALAPAERAGVALQIAAAARELLTEVGAAPNALEALAAIDLACIELIELPTESDHVH